MRADLGSKQYRECFFSNSLVHRLNCERLERRSLHGQLRWSLSN